MRFLDVGFFNKYPYTDFHEMNLDHLIRIVKMILENMKSFEAANKIVFADPLGWNITSQYAKNTVVIDAMGNAYISRQPVPAGIMISNTDFWLEIFNFTDYLTTIDRNFTNHMEFNTDHATTSYDVDDWLMIDNVAYKVIAAIDINDPFEEGVNIERFTIEEFCKAWVASLTALIQQYKHDIDESETSYRNQLAQDITNTTASLQAQLDAAISGVTVDSEVINARVSYDNITYPTLGDAVRTQIEDIHNYQNNASPFYSNATYPILDFGHEGYFLDNLGGVTAAAGWGYCDTYYPIPANTLIHFNTHGTTITIQMYNASKTFTMYSQATDDDYITSAADAAYIRISAQKEAWPFTSISIGYPGIHSGRSVVTVGPGKQYTRLRDGIAEANLRQNCDVIVYPGTYDLNTEFATEITAAASYPCGNILRNGIHVKFLPGSKVVAVFANNDTWANTWFSPFYSYQSIGDKYGFTLEGLDIECENTHYILHDDKGVGENHNKIINCNMNITVDGSLPFSGCIGGGFADHSIIEIVGGSYSSIYNGTTNNAALGYHNSSGVAAQSKMYVKDVYLDGDNTMDFSYHGTSPNISEVFVSNCKMGGPITVTPQTPGDTTVNVVLHEWNNITA